MREARVASSHRVGVGSTVALLLTVFLPACGGGGPTAVAYTSLEPHVVSRLEDAFREANPELRIRFEFMPSMQALARLREERAAPQADLWLGAPSWRLSQAEEEDLLEGGWSPVSADPMVLAFSADSVPRSRVPRDWSDVFHPRWSGEVLLLDAAGSDAMTALLAQHAWRAERQYGDAGQGLDWFARLDAWRKGYIGTGDAQPRLRAGDGLLALLPLSAAEAARSRGGVDYRMPESETSVLIQGVAAVAGGPHPQVAADFLRWLASPPAVDGLARVSGRFPAAVVLDGAPTWEPATGAPEWADRVLPFLVPYVLPADSMHGRVDGWVERWRNEVQGRTPTLF